MARRFEHRLMPCALAAQAFWQRSIAPFRWQARTLSQYPWPMQRSPRFVFALPAMRWVTEGVTKDARRSAGHRFSQATSARCALRRSMPVAAKSASIGVRMRQPRRAQSPMIRRVPSVAAIERTAPLRRRTPQPMRFVDRRNHLQVQRSTNPSAPAAARGASTVGRSRAAPRRVADARKPNPYFVSGKTTATYVFMGPGHRASAMHDSRSRPAPLEAVSIAARAVRPTLIWANRLHVGAARRRPSATGHHGYRSNHSRSASARRSDIRRQSLRRPDGDGQQARGRLAQLRYRSVLECFRTVSRERVLTFREAAALPHHREQAVAHVLGLVDVGPTKQAGVSRPVRLAGGSPVRASARHFVRRGSSLRLLPFLALPPKASQHTQDSSLTKALESVTRPVRLILRHRAEAASAREEPMLRASEYSPNDPRGERGGAYPSERGEARPQRAPAVEEVRRILIPLMEQALFSAGTMGRLTDGVISGVDRRDGVERYRKSGGR